MTNCKQFTFILKVAAKLVISKPPTRLYERNQLYINIQKDNVNGFKWTLVIRDITLDEAQRIVDMMSQAKKDAMNDILLGKIQPLILERYYMERNAEQLSKSIWFNILMVILAIGIVALGITLACVALTGIWGLACGIFKFILPLV